MRRLAPRGVSGVAVAAALLISALSPLAVTPALAQTPGPQERVSSERGLDPRTAYNASVDQYLVVWTAAEQTGANTEIFGRLVDGAGDPVGTEFQISRMGLAGDCDPDCDPRWFAWQPAVVFNPQANEYLVTWVGRDTVAEYEIYGQRLTAAGAETGTDDFRISSMGGAPFHTLQPEIAYNAQDNEYLVVWPGEKDTGGSVEDEVYGQRLTAAGAETGTNDFRISSMGPDGNVNYRAKLSAVAYNSTANEYLVTWDGNEVSGPNGGESEIYGQRLTAAGAATGTDDFRISTMGPDGSDLFYAHFPGVAYSPQADEYLVTWTGVDGAPLAAGEQEIFGQRLSASGAAAGVDDFRVSTAMGTDGNAAFGAGESAVAYNPVGNEYLVVWQGADDTAPFAPGELEIFGQRLTTAGVATGRDDFRISAMGPDGDADFRAIDPGVASGGRHNEWLVVWWGDHEADNKFGVFAGLVGPDADGDGSPDAQDCDDANASIRPGATDVPGNGVDEDCAGGDAQSPDADGDGASGPQAPAPGAPAAPAPPSGPVGPTSPGVVGPDDGDNVIDGTAAGEKICGLLGDDVIRAQAGNDTVFGDLCDVKAKAPGGDDTLYGGPGADVLYGAGGADRLFGEAGNDKLYGGDGNDRLSGGKGRDALDGGKGNDKLAGGAGVNTYKGGAGNDTVEARNRRRDTIDCGRGRKDSARVDKADKVRGCETVKRSRR